MSKQRHNQKHPCPVCGGYDGQARGGGRRCGGFTTDDGYAHCSRVECGEQEDGGTWAHRLNGSCRCGQPHGSVVVESTPSPVVDMPALWSSMSRRSLIGERYLDIRGTGSPELRERDVVRFHPHYGSPSVALRDLATGEVCGVQHRVTDPLATTKVLTAKGSRCSGAALYGRIAELDRQGADVAAIVEGLMDTATAVLAFPGCAVFGAPGAGQMAGITAAVAPVIRELRGWLLLVPHFDDDGIAGGKAARRAAEAAGLVLDRDLHLVDLGTHNDLNDAWRAGWRWQWSTDRGGAA